MATKTFEVPTVGCAFCVAAIKGELGDMQGVRAVDGDVATRMITVEWDEPASWDAIASALTAIDYAPAES
jgi:copper chaperone CopZ